MNTGCPVKFTNKTNKFAISHKILFMTKTQFKVKLRHAKFDYLILYLLKKLINEMSLIFSKLSYQDNFGLPVKKHLVFSNFVIHLILSMWY